MRRVVVTGMGMVTPLGAGVSHNWDRITKGDSGIVTIKSFKTEDLAAKIAGLVPTFGIENGAACEDAGLFRPDDSMAPKDQRKVGKFIVFGMGAADEAIADSGWLPQTDEEKCRTGVMIGSGIGGFEEISSTAIMMEEKSPRRVSPFFIPSALINLVGGQVSIKHGFKGPNHAVVTACATGTHAIGDAARMIMLDDADVMVAGGAEAAVNRLGMAGFSAARALSTGFADRPSEASRPWDKDRDGFVMGEGAAVVVLEELEHAKKRGATIYAEVVGYGMSGDAHHVTSPPEDGNGGRRAMEMALKRSGLNTSDIGYINAHGTSTPVGDTIEIRAVKDLFKSDIGGLSMSSTKSAIGHLLGAAGAAEAIYSIKALKTGILPPTLNLDNVSEDCQGVDLVAKVAKEKKVKAAISNSFGFGGTNASLIFKSFES